jgi:hypothetical protein
MLAQHMNQLNELQSLGLVLPSPAYLLGALLFGIVGYMAFRQGRRAQKLSLTWIGVGLMLYPYAVSETWLLWAVGMLLCAWTYFNWQ